MAPLTPRALLLLLTTLLASPSFAGTKLDLSPYLGIVRKVGDFKVFSFKGGERRVSVLEVAPWNKEKGLKEVTQATITGTLQSDGTAFFEDFLIPGKQLLSGSEVYDDGLMLYAKKPAKSLKLLIDPAKAQRMKQNTLLLVPCVSGLPCRERIGTGKRQAVWMIEGVEDVSTPSGDYPDALRVAILSGLTLRAGREKVVYAWRVTSWYAESRGLVRSEVDLDVTVNGAPQTPDSWQEELLSGRIGGVDFP